jgi:N-acetylglucosaminyldiphosphoundecaprenol N-acetyl-beta-D-mannosaminyltransferase
MSDRVRVGGLDFDVITGQQLIAHVTEAIRRGQGGTIVTPNIDICCRASRDPASRHFVESASLVVPDGVPLLWAARLAGLPLTERITGADLIFSLSEMAADNDFPVFVIGGLPATDGQPDTAHRAAQGIADRIRNVKVVGAYSPPTLFNAATDDIEALRDTLVATQPKIVFVGLGFPKQERLIARLSGDLPGTWFMGCGAAVMFAAGQVRRAPGWMQRTGTEWVYRLINEPRRLGRRYLVHDAPFALRLLVSSAWAWTRSRHRSVPDSSTEPVSEGRTAA